MEEKLAGKERQLLDANSGIVRGLAAGSFAIFLGHNAHFCSVNRGFLQVAGAINSIC